MSVSDDDIQITPEHLERVLANVTPDAVLVGGQALAVWIAHYRLERFIEDRNWSVSRDVDFLGSRADVTAIARGVHGRPQCM
ncbi:hypothetical protein PMI06_006622 [Burkholderia sp. BT03]|nr:hypothetical protein PMI06_006622 [Burkholderia sp. BT03]SKC93884.1 hypothetical protein SAMN06266956_5804 [Paraburkholderia hospita]